MDSDLEGVFRFKDYGIGGGTILLNSRVDRVVRKKPEQSICEWLRPRF